MIKLDNSLNQQIADTIYLKLDGSNANQNIDIGTYKLSMGSLLVDNNAQLGDAVTDYHGINTAPVQYQAITGVQTLANQTGYYSRETQSISSSSGNMTAYGKSFNQSIGGSLSGTMTDVFYADDVNVSFSGAAGDTTSLSMYGRRTNIDASVAFIYGTPTISLIGEEINITGNLGTDGTKNKVGKRIVLTGTGDLNQGMYVSASGATANIAGEFTDGTRTTYLANDSEALYSTDGLVGVRLINSGSVYAGLFENIFGTTVTLCDLSYAITAVGSASITGGLLIKNAAAADDTLTLSHDGTLAHIDTPSKLYIDSGSDIQIDSATGLFTFYDDGGAGAIYFRTDRTTEQTIWGVTDIAGNQLIIANASVQHLDFDHATQTNPTLYIHSDTSPDSDNTEWISFAHNQTNGVIGVGTGLVNIVNDVQIGDGTTDTLADIRCSNGNNDARLQLTETAALGGYVLYNGTTNVLSLGTMAAGGDIPCFTMARDTGATVFPNEFTVGDATGDRTVHILAGSGNDSALQLDETTGHGAILWYDGGTNMLHLDTNNGNSPVAGITIPKTDNYLRVERNSLRVGNDGVADSTLTLYSDTAGRAFSIVNYGNYCGFYAESNAMNFAFGSGYFQFTGNYGVAFRNYMMRSFIYGSTTFATTTNAQQVTYYMLAEGGFGAGTYKPDRKIEINTGAATDGLRISYNTAAGSATTYGELLLDSSGNLTMQAGATGSSVKLNQHSTGVRDYVYFYGYDNTDTKRYMSMQFQEGWVSIQGTSLVEWYSSFKLADDYHLRFGSSNDIYFQWIDASSQLQIYHYDSGNVVDVAIDKDKVIHTGDHYPLADNTYYIGKNDDDSPKAWKGVILKDQTDGKYYRVELNSGSLSIVDLTD